jgi:kynurenine 3-monooxygenase
MSDNEITIVGAGLVGSLLAVLLRDKGYAVSLYERYQDIRSIPSVGRSINLVATARGLRALGGLPPNVKAELLELGTKVTGRMIWGTSEEPIFQRYGKDDSEFNYSISRYELNKFLIRKAEEAGAKFHFGHGLVSMDVSGAYPKLKFKVDGGGEVDVQCPGPIVAADGGGSRVRYAMRDSGTCSFDELMLDSGYKEMIFPKEAASAGTMPAHGLHIWPCGSHMLMGLANQDGSFTGTIYVSNKEGDESFEALEQDKEGNGAALEFMRKHYASALPLLGGAEAAAKQLANNSRGILGTVRTKGWTCGGKAVLIGDAAHAIVPFFGQGMNSGFEDARELMAQLEAHAPANAPAKDYAAAFAAFEAARKPNADAIADMALENYVEMRASTADPTFRLRKAVENALENSELGDRFRSRYAMVCYGGAGGVTYAAAQALGKVQWEIVSELAEGVSSPEAASVEIDLGRAAKLLDEKLSPLQKELGVDLSTVSHHG